MNQPARRCAIYKAVQSASYAILHSTACRYSHDSAIMSLPESPWPGWSEPMPSIPMYLDDADVDLLVGWLNADPQIAFIVPQDDAQGGVAWKAVARVERLPDGPHILWHVPSGPLHYPDHLYPTDGLIFGMEKGPVIADPWAGWAVEDAGALPTTPGLGG